MLINRNNKIKTKHRILKKYRICGDCRANTEHYGQCDLGDLRKSSKAEWPDGFFHHNKPIEECPKPLTYQQLFDSPKKQERRR